MASSQVVLQSFKRQPSLEAYMQELLRIRSTTNGVGSKWPNSGEEEQSDIEENVGGIEADPDAIWLENAGFGSIVSQLKDDSGVEEGRDILFEASGLPKKHQAVVRKRMDTLRTTIKRQKDGDKKRYGHRSDVRNIFNSSRHSNTKTPGVVTTAVKTLLHSPLNSNSPTVSPSPHNSPGTSPRGSPTPTRHFQSSPSHSNGTSIPHSSLTTTAAASPATAQVSAVTGRQTNTSSLVRASESLTERDRVRIRVRSTHSHHQSSDSGIVSRDSSSSNEYTPDGHLDTSSPEPTGPNRGSSDGSQSDNDYNHHQSMSEEHRAPDVSPTSSTNSPTQEDIKLDFETRTSQSPLANETQELPDFMVMPDALGITHINDLSPGDMIKVRSVAVVELTITFEDLCVPLRMRRPAKPKSIPENSLFGVPLTNLLQSDQQRHPSTRIPLLFDKILSHLEENCLDDEGILRVPGSSSRLQSQKQEIDSKFNQGEFSFDGLKSSDLCSLLKMLIRELPIPLLTKEHLSAFASIPDISDLKEQVRTLNLLVLLLPSVHQVVLKRLLLFLERIIEHSANNKMDMLNVSMVIAPNLFMSLPTRHNLDDVTMASKTSQVVRLLIKYHRLLWTVPGEMLRQIRYLYEIEMKKFSTRSVQKALKQMQNQLIKGTVQSTQEAQQVGPHIVKVKAPLYTRVCMAVDVTNDITAGDIVAKLQKRSRLNRDLIRRRVSGINFSDSFFRQSNLQTAFPSSPVDESPTDPEEDNSKTVLGEQFVFEVGGNIGERCLPNDTDMCSLFKINPNAQWVIKPRDCPDL